MSEIADLVERLPEGWSVVEYDGHRYGVTRTLSVGGRAESVYAERLDGGDVVSANIYRVADGDLLKPCEMPERKVLDFLRGMTPSAPA